MSSESPSLRLVGWDQNSCFPILRTGLLKSGKTWHVLPRSFVLPELRGKENEKEKLIRSLVDILTSQQGV